MPDLRHRRGELGVRKARSTLDAGTLPPRFSRRQAWSTNCARRNSIDARPITPNVSVYHSLRKSACSSRRHRDVPIHTHIEKLTKPAELIAGRRCNGYPQRPRVMFGHRLSADVDVARRPSCVHKSIRQTETDACRTHDRPTSTRMGVVEAGKTNRNVFADRVYVPEARKARSGLEPWGDRLPRKGQRNHSLTDCEYQRERHITKVHAHSERSLPA